MVTYMRQLSSIVLLTFVVFMSACGHEIAAPSGARSGVTLLVINNTCVSGHCDSLRVVGFPNNRPATPGGLWSISLGIVAAPQTCLSLPASSKFYVITVPTRSSADTITTTWTSAIALSLGAFAPSTGLLQASPTTTSFVPADAPGWSITFPGDAMAIASSACTP